MEAQESSGKTTRKFQPTKGAPKKMIWNKFTKSKLEYFTRDPKEWMNYPELLRGDLQKKLQY